jgi:hypothetical protein
LTQEARSSLGNFIGEDRSLSARPLRQREFSITFRREVLQRLPLNQRSGIHFINHLSPLIRWITKVNQDRAHSFFNLSAVKINHPVLKPGDYCYRIERWKLNGLHRKERLAYGVRSLADGENYPSEESEAIIQYLLRNGSDWEYVDCDRQTLVHAHDLLEGALAERFSAAVGEFQAENETIYQIKTQRVKAIFDRRIAQHEQRLQTLREAGRDPRVVRATEGQLRTAIDNKEQRLQELKEKSKVDMEQSPVAAGVFRVIGTPNARNW